MQRNMKLIIRSSTQQSWNSDTTVTRNYVREISQFVTRSSIKMPHYVLHATPLSVCAVRARSWGRKVYIWHTFPSWQAQPITSFWRRKNNDPQASKYSSTTWWADRLVLVTCTRTCSMSTCCKYVCRSVKLYEQIRRLRTRLFYLQFSFCWEKRLLSFRTNQLAF